MGNLVFVISLTLFLSACGQKLPQFLEVKDIDFSQKNCATRLTGELPLVNGAILNLSEQSRKSLIIFASESCLSCTEEILNLKNYLQTKGGLPTNADIFSILIGATREDTEDWKNNLGIPWAVGYDYNLDLYKKYFSQLKTPSILVANIGQFIKCYQEVKGIQDLEREMGGWEF